MLPAHALDSERNMTAMRLKALLILLILLAPPVSPGPHGSSGH